MLSSQSCFKLSVKVTCNVHLHNHMRYLRPHNMHLRLPTAYTLDNHILWKNLVNPLDFIIVCVRLCCPPCSLTIGFDYITMILYHLCEQIFAPTTFVRGGERIASCMDIVYEGQAIVGI